MPGADTERERLARLEQNVDHLHQADDQHSQALNVLTDTIKVATTERKEDHKELVDKIDGFFLDHENRVTAVEGSTGSAHHRLDTFGTLLRWAGGILVTLGLAVAGFVAASGGP